MIHIFFPLDGQRTSTLGPHIYVQLVYKAPLYFTLRLKIAAVAYSKLFLFYFLKNERLIKILVWTLQDLRNNNCPQKVEKKNHPQKSLRNTQCFFSLLPWAAQTAKEEKFMFQNVSYRPTVYKTGVIPILLIPQYL